MIYFEHLVAISSGKLTVLEFDLWRPVHPGKWTDGPYVIDDLLDTR